MTLKAMPQADTVRNWLLGVIVAILAMGVFSAMRSIVVPVLFAVAVTILLWPVVERLSCRLPFALSVPVVLLAFALVAALVGALLAGSVQNMTRALPKYGSRLDAVVSHWVQFAREHGFDVKEVRSTEVARRVLAFIGQGFTSVLDFLGSLVLVVVLAIFGLGELRQMRARVTRAFGAERGGRALDAMATIAVQVRRYVWTKTWVSAATGSVVGIACAVLGIEAPVLWGFLAFVLNFVPYVGPALAVLPAILLAFLQFESTTPGIVSIVVLGGIQTLSGYVLEPHFMGGALRISSLFLLVAVVFWGWLLGMAGVVLGIPLSAAVVIACAHIEPLKPIAVLLTHGEGEAEGHCGGDAA